MIPVTQAKSAELIGLVPKVPVLVDHESYRAFACLCVHRELPVRGRHHATTNKQLADRTNSNGKGQYVKKSKVYTNTKFTCLSRKEKSKLPKSTNIISVTWIFKVKPRADGTIERFKC